MTQTHLARGDFLGALRKSVSGGGLFGIALAALVP
jgi:hypothetical protein